MLVVQSGWVPVLGVDRVVRLLFGRGVGVVGC